MQIFLNQNTNQEENKALKCANFFIDYILEEKEIFFENANFYLFLKTNFSESYIRKALQFPADVTKESIYEYFKKDGFWVIVCKVNGTISVYRDLSGICSGYYFNNQNEIHIATNVHKIAKNKAKDLNKTSVYQLLYFDFLWDGQTIYKDINQPKIGSKLVFNNDFKITINTCHQPDINEKENQLSDKENIEKLRHEIVTAHKNYVNEKNVVFLSGGIDSVAMLIALNDLTSKEKIINHSFKVKGTLQDETGYAQSIANHLENELLIVERDFSKEINEEFFKQEIIKMNNPYSGMWIFGNQITNKDNTTYFAGQDTRLHTPSLNKLDTIAFNMFLVSNKGLKPLFYIIDLCLLPFKGFFNLILKHTNTTNKLFLGLRRALYTFNTKSYINLVYFKVDRALIASYNLPLDYFNTIKKQYKFSLKNVTDKRTLYNKIVSLKWIEQYVNDMRYMIDMVNSQGAKLAMPFYDMDLAKFSATIPFDLSVKTMKGKAQFSDTTSTINKYVLREALVDKIDKKTYFRSKAVSRTGHLIFKQGLDTILKDILIDDINNDSSLVKDYNLEKFISKFLNNQEDWEMDDDKYLLKVYYLVCVIVYKNELNK
ncbi:asparagine synthase-related protein [Bizionia sp. M204]|uniref:asparagine synthase-related protein n=1 Tax=Bizionia sp. M204 TaxID=2675331 RepID=UPI0020575878|nr:asparagine synthase-related protein [Bizionia sp. M204]UPS92551.1 hypothetical protein GMA17_12810 [Bizionia sp. M204]